LAIEPAKMASLSKWQIFCYTKQTFSLIIHHSINDEA